MTTSQIFLSVIIPNYNEVRNLQRGVLTDIDNYLASKPFTSEVIISDDGSTDASLSLIKNFIASHPRFHLLTNSHAGKPFALRAGIQQARGEYLLFTDMDQSTPIQELDKLLPWLDKGYRVIIGSRGAYRRNAPLYRQLASLIFQLARRAILLPHITDTQCGFKLINRHLAQRIFANMQIFSHSSSAKGWKVTAYDVEMLHLATRLGEPIKEVPVLWQDEDISSGKSRNFLKESYDMLLEILRVKYNDIRGRYA